MQNALRVFHARARFRRQNVGTLREEDAPRKGLILTQKARTHHVKATPSESLILDAACKRSISQQNERTFQPRTPFEKNVRTLGCETLQRSPRSPAAPPPLASVDTNENMLFIAPSSNVLPGILYQVKKQSGGWRGAQPPSTKNENM